VLGNLRSHRGVLITTGVRGLHPDLQLDARPIGYGGISAGRGRVRVPGSVMAKYSHVAGRRASTGTDVERGTTLRKLAAATEVRATTGPDLQVCDTLRGGRIPGSGASAAPATRS
jgi:hypothetical protein